MTPPFRMAPLSTAAAWLAALAGRVLRVGEWMWR